MVRLGYCTEMEDPYWQMLSKTSSCEQTKLSTQNDVGCAPLALNVTAFNPD
jgi:hypothetical protein